jgi:hypothetical protein
MKKIMKWTGSILGGLIALLVLAGVVLYPIGMEKLTQTYPSLQPDFRQRRHRQVLHRR